MPPHLCFAVVFYPHPALVRAHVAECGGSPVVTLISWQPFSPNNPLNHQLATSYLDLEPLTGAPFRIAERLQLNIVVSDWKLPSVPLYDYFGWDTDTEKTVIKAGLEGAWIAIRDAAISGVEQAVHDVLYAEDGLCTVSAAEHTASCVATAHTLNAVIFNATYAFCHPPATEAPVVAPTVAPAVAPSASPTAAPAAVPVAAPTAGKPVTTPSPSKIAVPAPAPTAAGLPTAPQGRALLSTAAAEEIEGSVGSNPVCDVLGPLYAKSKFLADEQLAEALVEVHHLCSEDPATCERAKEQVRTQITAFYVERCGPEANMGSGPDPKEKALCAAAVAVGSGALTVFGGVERFCLGGVCELVEAITHMSQPPCETLRARRKATCDGLETWADEVIATQCDSGKNWTVPLGGDSVIVVTARMVCDMVHKLVLENDFDDNTDNDFNWHYPFPHGVFWKMGDDFCSSSKTATATCIGLSKTVQAEVDKWCTDPDADHEQACAAGLYVVQHWRGIDEKIVGGLGKFDAFCARDFCVQPSDDLDPDALEPLQKARANIAAQVLTFCQTDHVDIDTAFDHEHPWAHLATQCPAIVDMVSAATATYCADHELECSVVSQIPWRTVPMDDDGGPVLSWIEDTVIPKVQNVTSALRKWCAAGEAEGGDVPAWHADACAAAKSFAHAEVERAFSAVIAALDALAPQLNITQKAASARGWMTCVAAESNMVDFPEETTSTPGYFIPLTWADEYMDLPKGYTDDFKDQVQSVQTLGVAIHLWCLVGSVVFVLLAGAVVLARCLTKADYESEDRLLHREVTNKAIDRPRQAAKPVVLPLFVVCFIWGGRALFHPSSLLTHAVVSLPPLSSLFAPCRDPLSVGGAQGP